MPVRLCVVDANNSIVITADIINKNKLFFSFSEISASSIHVRNLHDDFL